MMFFVFLRLFALLWQGRIVEVDGFGLGIVLNWHRRFAPDRMVRHTHTHGARLFAGSRFLRFPARFTLCCSLLSYDFDRPVQPPHSC